ncbi:MAG: serine/threonine-protein kinase [Acidobacteria bacterium]|nr:serine/threonine-protein kinase [Acidobacteriota bacterium]
MTSGTLAHYQILQKLGEGGMGIVYKALDTHLDRVVALKVLPPQMVDDPERKRRFVQEAKAASALNHPNIVTIYDIASDQNTDFISMEFIEGKTLDEHIPRGGAKTAQALPLAIAIADALSKAHAAGIVHRDLKPSNIMITEEGRPKILDFGLAKLTDRTEPGSGDRTLVQKPATQQGAILGTVNYMSPEQAEGRKVDARSDVFSFGAVLYEMLTGQRAFDEETPVGTIAAVIGKEPARIIPGELGRIVVRCMRKDRERRYQSIADVRIALEDADLSPTPVATEQPARRNWLWPAVAFVCALAAATALLYRPKAPVTVSPTFTRLTTALGVSIQPSVWAPGKIVAYSSDRAEGNLDIWIQQLSGGEPRRLTTDASDEQEPSFSPDGSKIVFRSSRDGGGLYVIPALGGSERKVAGDGHHPRFSPDGKWIAYWSGYVSATLAVTDAVHIVPSGGGTPRTIPSARWPVWSSDGAHLLFASLDQKEKAWDWFVAPLDSLKARRIGMTAFSVLTVLQPSAWNGEWVYYAARSSEGANIQRIRMHKEKGITGQPEALTQGAGESADPSPSGPFLAFTQMEQNADIWGLPLDADSARVTGSLKRLTIDRGPDTQPSIDRNGRWLAYTARRVPHTFDLMLMDLHSGTERNLSSMPQLEVTLSRGGSPKISADASRIFYINRTDNKSYWIPSAGGLPQSICDCSVRNNTSSNDRVVGTTREGTFLLDVRTGARQQIMAKNGNALKLSWDDRWLTFYLVQPGNKSRVWVVPVRESLIPENDWIAITDGSTLDMIPEFSPDGNRLYFLSQRDGNRCIWTQRLDPATKHPLGPPAPVHHFHDARFSPIHNAAGSNEAAVARDKIVLPVTEQSARIWLAEWPEKPAP